MVKRIKIALITTLIALVVWVAATNFMTSLERSRQNKTMADVRNIATALEARATDFKSYTMGPVRRLPAGTFHRVPQAEVERALIPVYVRKLPRLDGWGQPIRVYVGGYDEKGRAQDYLVRSFGSDRRADTSRYVMGVTNSLQEDVVFSNGNFIRRPEGL